MSNFNDKAAISYICPTCGCITSTITGVFNLAGDMFVVKCPQCKSSKLTITKTIDKKIRFWVPCAFCKKDHSFVMPLSAIISRPLTTLPCAISGFDILFIGNPDDVSGAIRDTICNINAYFDKMDNNNPEDKKIVDSELYTEVIYTLRMLAHDGKIRCTCSKGNFATELNNTTLTIRCKVCHKCANIDVSEGSITGHNFLEAESLYLIDDYYGEEDEEDEKHD